MTFKITTLTLTLALGVFVVGCNSDDTDEGNGGTAGSGSNRDGGAGSGGGPTNFKATLQDPTALVAINTAHDILVLDNETGEELGKQAKSGTGGAFTIEDMPDGKVGFLVKGIAPDTIDTYQFNIDARAQDEDIWVVAKSTATLVPNLASFTADKTKASISGAVYWINAKGEEEKVGCATVEFAGSGDAADIRYFSDANLPTTIALRSSTNLLNGRYFVGNAPTGMQSVKAIVGGKELGSTALPLFAREDSSDGEDNVSISNIYVEADENPTPADCK
jgi:hypothetical protein